MGMIDMIRGPHRARVMEEIAILQTPGPPDDKFAAGNNFTRVVCRIDPKTRQSTQVGSPSHEVTSDAPAGIQKAEAAALMWSKSIVYGTYAW